MKVREGQDEENMNVEKTKVKESKLTVGNKDNLDKNG